VLVCGDKVCGQAEEYCRVAKFEDDVDVDVGCVREILCSGP
jgi:hypothetical protein